MCGKRSEYGCRSMLKERAVKEKERQMGKLGRDGDAERSARQVRREFQFPGDLWLPRRENRCRQPPNNHTSYDYHTPGVYTHAPYPCLFFILSRSLFPYKHACPPLLSFFHLLTTFFNTTCLITNSRSA